MKVLILSSDSLISSTQLLVKALKRKGMKPEVKDPRDFWFRFHPIRIMYKNKEFHKPDLVIPRFGWITFEHGLKLVRTFESWGVNILNGSDSLIKSHDKLACIQILQRVHLPLPETWYFDPPQEFHLQAKLPSPAVIKVLMGSQGKGVALAQKPAELLAWIDFLRTAKTSFLVQEYLTGTEVRVLVCNGQVIAAMERHPKKGEFRSNLHLGGVGKKTRLSTFEESLAIEAVKSLGLKLGGVDLMRDKKLSRVLEVNAFPGLEGITKVSGIPVALKIAEEIKSMY